MKKSLVEGRDTFVIRCNECGCIYSYDRSDITFTVNTKDWTRRLCTNCPECNCVNRHLATKNIKRPIVGILVLKNKIETMIENI